MGQTHTEKRLPSDTKDPYDDVGKPEHETEHTRCNLHRDHSPTSSTISRTDIPSYKHSPSVLGALAEVVNGHQPETMKSLRNPSMSTTPPTDIGALTGHQDEGRETAWECGEKARKRRRKRRVTHNCSSA